MALFLAITPGIKLQSILFCSHWGSKVSKERVLPYWITHWWSRRPIHSIELCKEEQSTTNLNSWIPAETADFIAIPNIAHSSASRLSQDVSFTSIKSKKWIDIYICLTAEKSINSVRNLIKRVWIHMEENKLELVGFSSGAAQRGSFEWTPISCNGKIQFDAVRVS